MLKLKVAVELKHFRLRLAGAVRANALTCLHGCVLAGNDISYLVQLRFSPNFQLNLQEYLANDSTLPLDIEALRDDRIYYCRIRPLSLGW